MADDRVICKRRIFIVGRGGERSPVDIAMRVPERRTHLETKLSQVACIVETDIGLGVSRREMLGYDLMNALAQALIGIEVFIASLGASAKLEFEDGTPFDRDLHAVFLGPIYREYMNSLKKQSKSKNGGTRRATRKRHGS